MGFQVTGAGKGPGKSVNAVHAGTILPQKRRKKQPATNSPGLAGVHDDEEDDDDATDGILAIDHKEAYMAAGTAEKIAAKHNVSLSLGEDKSAPISLTAAATEISGHNPFTRRKWLKARQDMFGLSAPSAGSRLNEKAIVSSVLCGYLGKCPDKL